MTRVLLLSLVPAVLAALVACPRAHASRNAIPAAQTTFRSTLGAASQPFATPGDWVEISLDGRCDGEVSPGFSGPSRNQVVTVIFTPPSGPRNIVTLASDCAGTQAANGQRVILGVLGTLSPWCGHLAHPGDVAQNSACAQRFIVKPEPS